MNKIIFNISWLMKFKISYLREKKSMSSLLGILHRELNSRNWASVSPVKAEVFRNNPEQKTKETHIGNDLPDPHGYIPRMSVQ